MADLKLQIDAADAFVYPDPMVSCDPRDTGREADFCLCHPSLVLEVLIGSDAAYDQRERVPCDEVTGA